MNKEVAIRPAARSDYPSWKVLWEKYNAFYGRQHETALPAEIVAMTWSRFFDAYEPMHAIVAELDGKCVGIAHFLYHRSTTQIAPVCYLQDLFTLEEMRGQGVGRALINYIYDHAKNAGSSRVYWQTHQSNVDAMKLYDRVAEKSGFIVYRQAL
ncbi:MAG: GNAT family N-acetyltransferase [Pseudomonadota bacterium]